MNAIDTTLQIRVLYRQFLFRLMDAELLSASAAGDFNSLLGQFGALLISISLLLSWFALPIGMGIHKQGVPEPVWAVERFMVSLTMLVVGIFALLSWDSAFPDRRDVLVLAPLPVSGRALFAAKVAAAGSAVALIVAALNSLAGFVWPLAISPAGSGIFGTLQFVLAFWFVLLLSGAFIYCTILGVQALAAQLPRRWYLQLSPVLQIAIFVLMLGVFFFQPSFSTAKELTAPINQRTLAWMPQYWFMALLGELSGAFRAQSHAVLLPLARRAIFGMPLAMLAAGLAFLLSYLRTLRKMIEEPDIAPGSRTRLRLSLCGHSPRIALTQFVLRTLLRSRQHRVILAFYLGGGFAVAVVYLQGARDMMHVSWQALLHQVNFPMLVASTVMLSAAWLGTRTVFALPLDLRANWVFRVTPPAANRDSRTAARRALLAVTALPVAAASAAILFPLWPWQPVAQHLLLLALAGSIIADLSLRTFRKIPFTCSCLPGKSKVHMIFWLGVIPVVIAIHKASRFELQTMSDARLYWILVTVLAAAAVAARRITDRTAQVEEAEVQFEDSRGDELLQLRLNG